MWMLSFIPDTIIHLAVLAVLFTGIGLYVLGMFINLVPSLFKYKEPIRLLATVLIIAGVYFYGSYDTEMAWRAKVAEVQAKVEEAKKESEDANAKLAKVSKQKQKVRVEYYATVKERIKEVEKRIDSDCKLDPVVPKLHNQSAMNPNRNGNVTINEVKE
jgi:ABC-type antimicrobial peptide transport system permease subunit